MTLYKYPRTPHLPWSPGVSNDDKIITSLDRLKSSSIVITEKMDGENTTLYNNYIHSRSLTPLKNHPSRSYIKTLHSNIKHNIPDGWRICGENMYAKHSIYYDQLESYFLVFSIWDDNNQCLSWLDTALYTEALDLKTVPVIYIGQWKQTFIDAIKLRTDQEGYVIRVSSDFEMSNFSECIAKYVRANHVNTDSHWLYQEVIANRLKEDICRFQ